MEFDIEEIEIKGYKWVCPEDGKEIVTDSKAKTLSQAKQHWYTKHS